MECSTEQTSIVHDLFCVARKCYTPVLRANVQLFSTDSKVLDPSPKHMGSDLPSVSRSVSVEQGVHNLDRLVREFIGLDDPLKRGIMSTRAVQKG